MKLKNKHFLEIIIIGLLIVSSFVFVEQNFAEEKPNSSFSFIVNDSKENILKKLEDYSKIKFYIKGNDDKAYLFDFKKFFENMQIDEYAGTKINNLFLPSFESNAGGSGSTLSVSSRITISNLDNIASSIINTKENVFKIPIQDIEVKKNDKGVYIFSGDLKDGFDIDKESLKKTITTLLKNPKKVRGINVPLTYQSARIKKVDGDKVENLEIFGHGESFMNGSTTSRIFNIHTAMNRFNGQIIPAHSTFSFTKILGEVNGETGYKKELVIKGSKTVPDWGGGVCQVSSTFFRTALDSGFPIVERKPHSYAVSYYKPWGTDATVYTGVVDLKFTNDSDSDLIIHTFTEGLKLTVNFYGKKDGREVTMIGPTIYGNQGYPAPKIEKTKSLPTGKQVLKEYGHPGFAAKWTRIVTKDGKEVINEVINSIYDPRPAVMLEGE